MKRKISALLMAALLSMTVLAACGTENAPAGGTPSDPQTGGYDRVVTDYGVEVLEPFTLPVMPAAGTSVTVTDESGAPVSVTVDAQNRITFTEIGDYTLTITAADGTHTYSLYVRDTKAPVFGSVTQVSSCLVGDSFDLTKLHVAVDDYSAVTMSYKVYHMAATEVPVTNGRFLAEEAGYYIVVTKAEDASGNCYTYRSKIWCGAMGDNEINSFDDMFLMETSSTGTFSDEIRMGNTGYSLKFSATSTDNYATCGHPRDLSEVIDIYYYVYVDSSSWRNANADDGVGELPEIVSLNVLPGIVGWTRGALADLEFDTWIPMVAKRNSGTAPLTGNTIQFYGNNREVPWGLPKTSDEDGWGAYSGYSYDIYIDNLTYAYEEPLPETPELAYAQGETLFYRSDTVEKIDTADISLPDGVSADAVTLTGDFGKSDIVRVNADGTEIGWFRVEFVTGTVLQDFSAGAASYTNAGGYGAAFFTGETKIGYTGSSLGINFNVNRDLGRTSYLSATTAAEMYYYVYFDSTTFQPIAGSPVTELPALTEARVASIRPQGWTGEVVDPSAVGWDRWILVKATRTTNEEITELFWYIGNYLPSWGVEDDDSYNSGAVGCQVFVDDMFTL